MNNEDKNSFFKKVEEGLKLSYIKLVEDYQRRDDELILSKDGKIVKVRARDIKL